MSTMLSGGMAVEKAAVPIASDGRVSTRCPNKSVP